MIAPEKLFAGLRARGVDFFTGVPDSLLSSFCAYVDDHGDQCEHIITANEGNAIAMAIGNYMATGNPAVVYMQNSGLGNAVNPLASLADPEVYNIPLLMVIGWRGEPGLKDEPQHVKQGRITPGQLELLEVPSWILSADSGVDETLDEVFAEINGKNSPVALLVRKNTFNNYSSARKVETNTELSREDALRQLLSLADARDLIVSTTGKTSRELFELRVSRDDAPCDFLTVGGMGHTSSIALGVALGKPKRRVLCLDGDGSLLMHMGALPIIGSLKPKNFIHVLLNNKAHESVGGQPTVAGNVDFEAIAGASGYSAYFQAKDEVALTKCWRQIESIGGPILFEVQIRKGSRPDLGRPANTPEQNKVAFMEHAQGQKHAEIRMGIS